VCDDIRCFADDAFREINGGNARAPRDVEEPDVDADADMEGGRGRGLRSDSSNAEQLKKDWKGKKERKTTC
jgi:hypothetical protein